MSLRIESTFERRVTFFHSGSLLGSNMSVHSPVTCRAQLYSCTVSHLSGPTFITPCTAQTSRHTGHAPSTPAPSTATMGQHSNTTTLHFINIISTFINWNENIKISWKLRVDMRLQRWWADIKATNYVLVIYPPSILWRSGIARKTSCAAKCLDYQ